MITLLATMVIVGDIWVDVRNRFPRRRSRAHLEKILDEARRSGTLGITRLRLSSEMYSMIPSLFDMTALKPRPNIIISGVSHNYDDMILRRLIKGYQEILVDVEKEKVSRRKAQVQTSNIRKSCKSFLRDIDVVTKATESRENEKKKLQEDAGKLELQYEEMGRLEADNIRIKKSVDFLQEEIECLKEHQQTLQEGRTPYDAEIEQQVQLWEEEQGKNNNLGKDIISSEKCLVHDERRLQRTKNNLQRLLREREDLVVSPFTQDDMERLYVEEERYWCACKILAVVAMCVLVVLIYQLVTRV